MSFWIDHLQCPDCGTGALPADLDSDRIACPRCGAGFQVIDRRPVLIKHGDGLFAEVDYKHAIKASQAVSDTGWHLSSLVPSPSVNLSKHRVLRRLVEILDSRGPVNLLVVGGGKQRTWLDPVLLAAVPHRVCYVDIDVGALVDVFCDAHDIPFMDQTFDGVITTAVLEHVMYPERVAAEMARVLRPDGLIYSELPFMQQVHEGAYDFTRYTLSGHRRLLNAFSEIEVGMVAGPATALVWAIENLALALAPNSLRRASKAIVRLLLGWVKYLDWFLKHRPQAMDGASCTYFLGRRRHGTERTADSEIVRTYIGGGHLTHT